MEHILDYGKGFAFSSLHHRKPLESLQHRNNISRFIFKIKSLGLLLEKLNIGGEEGKKRRGGVRVEAKKTRKERMVETWIRNRGISDKKVSDLDIFQRKS